MSRLPANFLRTGGRAIARCAVVAIAAAGGVTLAGCAGFFPGPPSIPVEFQSMPAGAEARTSMGQSCITPCSIRLPAPDGDFTVSFALANFQPLTIPVHITRIVGGLTMPPMTSLNPNPVVAQLQPVVPVKRPKKRKQAAAR